MRYVVDEMPRLVAYTEMLRDAEARGSGTGSGDPGTFLLLRCVIAGPARFGLRPVKAVGWWDRGWRRASDAAVLRP